MNIAHLRKVAEAADSDGRSWVWQGGYPQRILRVGDVAIVADTFESPDHPARFAEFIGTFDPPTVLALLALVPEQKGKPRPDFDPGIDYPERHTGMRSDD